MTIHELIQHFRTQKGVADALGVRQPAVSKWLSKGRVPLAAQVVAEEVTGGVLRANLADARLEIGSLRNGSA